MELRQNNIGTVLVFKTNIMNRKKAQLIAPFFNREKEIINWSVDVKDIDKVLRIEAGDYLTERYVIDLVSRVGFIGVVMDW